MNRDGYRAGDSVARHEAAHAVVAVLCGLVVERVDIAPSQAERAVDMDGGTWMHCPQTVWHIRLHRFADPVSTAAGFVSDLRDRHGLRVAWSGSAGDRQAVGLLRFGFGAVLASVMLARRPVRAAVQETATVLQARRSGVIWGTTVEKICRRHGLLPVAGAS